MDKFVELDARQEKEKADLHKTSADQWIIRRGLMAEFGRWVSVLEGQLGKNAEKLQEFGIAPRNLRPHKGPRAKTAPNTPASISHPANNNPANTTPATSPPAQPQVEA